VRFRLIERAGSGSGRYFRLTRGAYESLSDELEYDIDKRLTLANARARVLEALADRSLTNAEIREITQLDRQGVLRMMERLAEDGLVRLRKAGRFSSWERTQ
jgi:ATP-dependent DNA helicase RecG